MTFKMSQKIWSNLCSFVLFSLILPYAIVAIPATSTAATTFIVNYVSQRRATESPDTGDEFELERFRTNLKISNPETKGALQQLFGRLVDGYETNMDNVDKDAEAKSVSSMEAAKENEISYMTDGDDSMDGMANTLDIGFGNNEQHESQINETVWQRTKQSIPVLEPVRHLLHSVRNGALNDTVSGHHQFLKGGGGVDGMDMTMPHNGSETSAIETEEDREMINGSNDLKFLEVLGSLGSRVWGFLSSLKQVFAASSGSASATLAAQSSSSSF